MQEPTELLMLKEKVKILVVDDHPIVRHGISQLIRQEPDLTICGEAEDIETALEAIATFHPDLVLVDISLKGTDGIKLIKEVKTQYPSILLLVVSMHEESLYAERALRMGAMGYIMKQEAPEKMLTAIRRVLDGEVYLSPKMLKHILSRSSEHPGRHPSGFPFTRLSEREQEVLHFIGQGLGTKQIADKLHLSVKTVEAYRAHIKEKMNLKNATELLRYAIQWVQDEAFCRDSPYPLEK